MLWGWAGEPLDADDARACARWSSSCAVRASDLRAALPGLLTADEVAATLRRGASGCCGRNVMPAPSGGRPSIPWPAF